MPWPAQFEPIWPWPKAGLQRRTLTLGWGDEPTTEAAKTYCAGSTRRQKSELIRWCEHKRAQLSSHQLFATGTTAARLSEALDLPVQALLVWAHGGDQQIGAKIAEGQLDLLVFFWDPMSQMPHDPDIKALLRIAAVWNIPVACNSASADFMFSSSLIDTEYEYPVPDYQTYLAGRTTPSA